ncbi:MAG: hypothetical protein QM743_02685 [Chitinophagaceae bacterium]
MKKKIALLLYVFAGSITVCHAQLTDLKRRLYLDSNNVRLHISEFTSAISEAGQMIWNTATRRYESPLPHALRSRLLVRPPFRKLRVLQKEKSRFYGYNNWGAEQDTLIRVLNRESFDTSELYAVKELNYDEQGRLTLLSTERFFKDNKDGYRDRDTTFISYTTLPGDSLLIRISYHSRKEAKNNFYSSVYFRTSFKDKPLTVLEFSENSYLFDRNLRLIRQTYDYDVFANGEKGSFREDSQRDYTYDHAGRVINIRDSLTNLHLLQSVQQFQYQSTGGVHDPRITGSVQAQRWLQHYPGAYEMTVTEDARWLTQHDYDSVKVLASPIVRSETQRLICSAEGKTIGSLPPAGQPPYLSFLQEFADSIGDFHGWYKVYVPSEREDTSWYVPGSIGSSRTLHLGCVVETYNEIPRGTLELSNAAALNKRTRVLRDRSRLIEYSSKSYGMPDHSYWSPVYFRYISVDYPDFILTTPDGRLSYVQDEEYLYRVIYQP